MGRVGVAARRRGARGAGGVGERGGTGSGGRRCGWEALGPVVRCSGGSPVLVAGGEPVDEERHGSDPDGRPDEPAEAPAPVVGEPAEGPAEHAQHREDHRAGHAGRPAAASCFFGMDAPVRLRQQCPGNAVEQHADAEDGQQNEQPADQDRVQPDPVPDAGSDAADPAVLPAGDAEVAKPAKKRVARRRNRCSGRRGREGAGSARRRRRREARVAASKARSAGVARACRSAGIAGADRRGRVGSRRKGFGGIGPTVIAGSVVGPRCLDGLSVVVACSVVGVGSGSRRRVRLGGVGFHGRRLCGPWFGGLRLDDLRFAGWGSRCRLAGFGGFGSGRLAGCGRRCRLGSGFGSGRLLVRFACAVGAVIL